MNLVLCAEFHCQISGPILTRTIDSSFKHFTTKPGNRTTVMQTGVTEEKHF